jgi:hypothetical protein
MESHNRLPGLGHLQTFSGLYQTSPRIRAFPWLPIERFMSARKTLTANKKNDKTYIERFSICNVSPKFAAVSRAMNSLCNLPDLLGPAS